MINIFELLNGRLRQTQAIRHSDLAGKAPIWIDIVEPTEEESAWAHEQWGLDLETPEDLTDIEASARFYETDDGALHLRSDFLLDKDDDDHNVPVRFVLRGGLLFSIRDDDLPVFRLSRMRARTQPGHVSDAMDVLLDLYATDVEYSADALEEIYGALDEVSRHVLGNQLSDEAAGEVLSSIAKEEDTNGRIRRNVMDTRRAVSFLMRGKRLTNEQFEEARQILRDIDSLDGHTTFLFDKINFLMDATVGFININQNKIIKIFSVASVALLPPTLIASVYGMNFGRMPELQWEYGYPFSLILMILSVIAPFTYFRRRGWLK
ncbi:magnesium/cobalt transporter CorA [Oryzomicrobium sp.]|uniref:magnesium/cobalt transporter CorA n=1 Tax=Oryzomicrobium sp. TaxID=1911578 RepID=UPI0025F8DCB4|nr:magnesium/cobalt transporter CorA [Oryzomicrobium sp.]MCE1242214.1 magnesium/cobalt transporter CorA [Oryzomicrobium sp.]